MSEQQAHARLSASQAPRWSKCPGSVNLIASMPEEYRSASGDAAKTGTCAHHLLECCLKKGWDADRFLDWVLILMDDDKSEVLLTQKVSDTSKKFWAVVDRDMTEAVQVAIDYVRERCVELGIPLKSISLERRVVPHPERDDTGGMADVIIDAWPYCLEVIDYKHGSGVYVEVEDNEQLKEYALGAAREFGFDYDHVRYTICQPRHFRGPAVRTDIIGPDELQSWGQDMLGVAAQTDDEDAPFNPGPEQCKWCDAKSIGPDGVPFCRAFLRNVEKLAQVDFEEDPGISDKKLEVPDNPGQLGRTLAWIDLIQSWGKECFATAQKQMESGHQVPGYKLVRGQSNRAWVKMEEREIEKLMIKEGYIGKNEIPKLYNEPKMKTGVQVQGLLDKDHKSDFEAMLLHKPEGKITITHKGDNRKAIEVNAGDDFEDAT